MRKVSKSPSVKRVINSVQFIITGITILDITFYSSVELGYHELGNKENNFGSYLSFALAILSVLFILLDVTQIVYYSFSKLKMEGTNDTTQVNSYIRFSSIGWKNQNFEKSPLARSLNAFFVLRFVLSQILIASLQKSPNTTSWILIIMNGAYFILLIAAFIKHKTIIASTCEFIQKIFLEICLMIFLVMVKIFAADPKNNEYSSTKTENMQRIVMILVVVAVVNQIIAFALAILREFKAKKKSTASEGENKWNVGRNGEEVNIYFFNVF